MEDRVVPWLRKFSHAVSWGSTPSAGRNIMVVTPTPVCVCVCNTVEHAKYLLPELLCELDNLSNFPRCIFTFRESTHSWNHTSVIFS